MLEKGYILMSIKQFSDLTKEDLLMVSLCRQMGWGRFMVTVKNGQPVSLDEIIKTINLERNN